jgi:hypothetical protein
VIYNIPPYETPLPMPNTKRKDMKHTNHKKLLIISEELTKSPSGNQFLDLFTKEHDIIMIDYEFLQDKKDEPLNLRARTKKMYTNLKPYLETSYSHRVFIGFAEDGYYLFELFLDKGIVFDGAVLINCNVNGYTEANFDKLAPLFKKTKIWNFYSRNHLECRNSVQGFNNYMIPTIRSPQFNSRYALETYGVITYGVYGRLSLLEQRGSIQMLSSVG